MAAKLQVTTIFEQFYNQDLDHFVDEIECVSIPNIMSQLQTGLININYLDTVSPLCLFNGLSSSHGTPEMEK